MFQTFTGSSRRPRQVNLSGRNTNPFTNQRPTGGTGTQTALVNAQQDRLHRQQERERAQAATLLQKTWRGAVIRRSIRDVQRKAWDEVEAKADGVQKDGSMEIDEDAGAVPYNSESDALSQLGLLLLFVDLEDTRDFQRFQRYYQRLLTTIAAQSNNCHGGPWPLAYLRLENTCLNALPRPIPDTQFQKLLEIMEFIAKRIPHETSRNSARFFSNLFPKALISERGLDLLCMPLLSISPTTVTAYENFASHILMKPEVREVLQRHALFDKLSGIINCKLLAKGIIRLLKETASWLETPVVARLALLTNFIYFYRHVHGFKMPERYVAERDFIFVVSTLLSSLVDDIKVESGISDTEMDIDGTFKSSNPQLVDQFSRDQLLSLVTQDSIAGLLARMGSDADGYQGSTHISAPTSAQTRVLANYILTILRLFPRRGDEIRMWLYMGLSLRTDNDAGESSPVIAHFWNAARNTHVFGEISRNSRTAVALLKTRQSQLQDGISSSGKTPLSLSSELDDQWRVILLFIELYLFILKIMDDEEFFSRSQVLQGSGKMSQRTNLSLEDIRELVTFLKHLGFTMYYNAPEILGNSDDRDHTDISSFFKLDSQQGTSQSSNSQSRKKNQDIHIAGVQGMSLDHVKELVTGLLRAIYERDSRRPFLPKDHWLMTSRFDMGNFIDAVVEEEEKRKQVQDDDEEEEGEGSDGEDSQATYVGTGLAMRAQKLQRLQRQQRKASRRRYLQAVAPRQEILRNMPFLIPFTTRVQIFRRFIYLDQVKRRNGVVDPELWRINQNMFGSQALQKHHAKIRRDFEFEDAYDQFYNLGADLKEPISITFVDRFDQVEAGIDGGGVTKEFLTSVTSQAFSTTDSDIQLFSENDQHLLFPNPSAVEEQKEYLKHCGMLANTPEFKAEVMDLLQRYEFLGRIIGKCLYEGILVDISFAGFFLLKWALTGGTGAAPQESGYRANLNDLRDYDEGLYQGLLQLKNYAGDVEDFTLNFTVADTLRIPTGDSRNPPRTKTVTHELRPGGSAMPVTNANRPLYISYVARHRLTVQPFAQTSAFLKGLAAMIQPSWLSMFNQAELQTLVGGTASTISIADLRASTVYGGLYVIGDDGLEHPTVRLFWEVMEGLSEEDKGAVLKFVTSTPRAPLLGFASLNPRFSIRDSGDDEARLPSTSTCVNLLKLPRYSRRETLKAKLLQAVSSGAGFDLS